MKLHPRFVVKVSGDKPPFHSNPTYYATINDVVQLASDKHEWPAILHTHPEEPTDEIADIVCPTMELARYISNTLTGKRLYRSVTISDESLSIPDS